MRLGRLGTIDGADRLAILPLDACHVQTFWAGESERASTEYRGPCRAGPHDLGSVITLALGTRRVTPEYFRIESIDG
jgi:hypothetical protein